MLSRWHPEYPLPDSLDGIAMAMAAHEAMTGVIGETPGWWVHQIVVDGLVVGDIGFHGPPGPDSVVEIGYSVVPAWRGRGVATRACELILEQAWQDGAEIVVAETDDDNVASQAVLVRNGFHRNVDGLFMIKRPDRAAAVLRRSERRRSFLCERRRSRRLQSAIRARDVRAADLQEEPRKRDENGADSVNDRFVGSDEDGGSSANIAASGASHQRERTQ